MIILTIFIHHCLEPLRSKPRVPSHLCYNLLTTPTRNETRTPTRNLGIKSLVTVLSPQPRGLSFFSLYLGVLNLTLVSVLLSQTISSVTLFQQPSLQRTRTQSNHNAVLPARTSQQPHTYTCQPRSNTPPFSPKKRTIYHNSPASLQLPSTNLSYTPSLFNIPLTTHLPQAAKSHHKSSCPIPQDRRLAAWDSRLHF